MTSAADSPIAAQHKTRLDNIDLLRAVAVIMVVLYHFTSFRYCKFGVQLFFIVSGFCIWMTAARCPNLATFWTRQLGRIQPTYVAAAILTFAVVAAFGLPGRAVGMTDLFANLTWATVFSPATPFVDGVYWSLVVELKFYVCFGLIVFGLRRWIKPLDAFIALTLFAVVLMAIAEFHPGDKAPAFVSYLLGTRGLLRYTPFFLVGIALYDWDKAGMVRLLICGLVYIAAVVLRARDTESMLVLLTLLPVSAAVLLSPTLLIPAPVRFIGLISYPLYLVHQNIGYVVLRGTAGWIESDYLRILPAIVTVVAIAALLHLLVEERARKPFERFVQLPLSSAIAAPGAAYRKLYESKSTKSLTSPLGREAEASQSRK